MKYKQKILIAALLSAIGVVTYVFYKIDKPITIQIVESKIGKENKCKSPQQYSYSVTFQEKHFCLPININLLTWKKDLISKLKFKGKLFTFMLTDLELFYKKESIQDAIYRSIEIPTLFLVIHSKQKKEVLIDLDRSIIGTMGCGGVSLHQTQNRKMAICLIPDPNPNSLEFYGVLLSDSSKTGMPKPIFIDKTVTWEW